MQKKIFVQKNLHSAGSRSYAKLLLWAALSLIILVLIAPLFSRHSKENREALKRPDSDKGMVVKEIPRSLELLKENGGEGQTASVEVPTPPRSEHPTDQGLSRPPEAEVTQQATSMETRPAVGEAQMADKAQPWVEMPKPVDTAAVKEAIPLPAPPGVTQSASQEESATVKEKTAAPAEGKVTSVSPETAKEKKSKKASAAVETRKTSTARGLAATSGTLTKPSPSGGPMNYSVQVGSFKDKQNAEEMQQNLQKKGYQVVMKPTMHPKLGQIYVVQLTPVGDVRKASTLVEQIRNEERVKPIIVKVPQEEQ